MNLLMMTMVQQLAQQIGVVLPQLPIPRAAQLPQPAIPPFTSAGAPYFTSVAPVDTAAPPVGTALVPSPVSGFGMTLLLAPSVVEPVSASVAQPQRPVSTLPAATPARDVAPTEEVTVALPLEVSPLLSRTLEFDTPTSVIQPTQSQIEDLLAAGYTEAEIQGQSTQPPTESVRVTTSVESPAGSGQ